MNPHSGSSSHTASSPPVTPDPRRRRTERHRAARLAVAGLVLLLATIIIPGLAAQEVDTTGFLERIDENLTLENKDFSAVMTLVSEDPEEGIDRRRARIFRRDRDGAYVLLVLEPAVNRGQGYLQVEDALWFYDPESRSFSYSSALTVAREA